MKIYLIYVLVADLKDNCLLR